MLNTYLLGGAFGLGLLLLLLTVSLSASRTLPVSDPVSASERRVAVEGDSLEAERQYYIEQILSEIAGREDEPASEVFEDVQVLGRHPARRFLSIMNAGFGRALGVSCTHCHIAENWSEPTREKRITREMSAMTRRINEELLSEIEGLSDGERPPAVNCTTCHRGAVKPALNLPRPASNAR